MTVFSRKFLRALSVLAVACHPVRRPLLRRRRSGQLPSGSVGLIGPTMLIYAPPMSEVKR